MMASSLWSEDRYSTHFFCAFCGGPFSRVNRTEEPYRNPKTRKQSSGPGRKRRRTTRNSVTDLPERFLHDDLAATVHTSASDGPDRTATSAYPGRDVKQEDLKWTRVLRALIHKDAQIQPEGGQEQADEEQDVYLTGRGRVREDASWADAHPSIQDDLDDREDENDTTEEDDDAPTFHDDFSRFHMYQEPDRNDRKYLISSVPFHEECWDIMLQALNHSRAIRGLPDQAVEELLDLDIIWAYLVNLIPTAVDGRLSDLTVDAMTRGIAGDYIRRLSIGCMGNEGYREAQRAGHGSKWDHIEGQHVCPHRYAQIPHKSQKLTLQSGW